MKYRHTAFFAASVAIMLLAFTAIASAGTFSSVIVYGDSLSDNGNLYGAIGYPPSPPYYNGRFSNGPVAVEQLATMLGSPLVDFAWGGATTGQGNYVDGGTQTSTGGLGLPGMIPELIGSESVLPTLNVPNSLFIVWGGANDFLTGGSPTTAVEDLVSIIAFLQSQGATHILVPGVPDLGLTPDFNGTPEAAVATAYSLAFNSELQAALPAGTIYVDTFGLMHEIVSNPSAYGLTDVTDPCFNGVTVCADPSAFLFWDGFHPTTTADTILADDFASEVPEPSSLLLLGTGIAGLARMLRRRRAA